MLDRENTQSPWPLIAIAKLLFVYLHTCSILRVSMKCSVIGFGWNLLPLQTNIHTSYYFIIRRAMHINFWEKRRNRSKKTIWVATVWFHTIDMSTYVYYTLHTRCKIHDKISVVMAVKYNFIAVVYISRPIVSIVFATLSAN